MASAGKLTLLAILGAIAIVLGTISFALTILLNQKKSVIRTQKKAPITLNATKLEETTNSYTRPFDPSRDLQAHRQFAPDPISPRTSSDAYLSEAIRLFGDEYPLGDGGAELYSNTGADFGKRSRKERKKKQLGLLISVRGTGIKFNVPHYLTNWDAFHGGLNKILGTLFQKLTRPASKQKTKKKDTYFEAFRHLEQAAKMGNPHAQHALAHALTSGIFLGEESPPLNFSSSTTNQSHALLLYHLSAISGDTESQMALGYRYHASWRVSADESDLIGKEPYGVMGSCEMALAYYEEAAHGVMDELEGGWGRGKIVPSTDRHRLSEIHMVGSGPLLAHYNKPDEHSEALEYYRLRATSAHGTLDINAAYTLAHYYHYGTRGVEQNLAQALNYYEIAADGGSVEAAGQAGLFHLIGIGYDNIQSRDKQYDPDSKLEVHGDLLKAYRYLRKAVPGGLSGCTKRHRQNDENEEDCDVRALNGMGILYLIGVPHVLEPDREMAKKFLTLARDMGSSDASYNLAMMRLGWLEQWEDVEEMDDVMSDAEQEQNVNIEQSEAEKLKDEKESKVEETTKNEAEQKENPADNQISQLKKMIEKMRDDAKQEAKNIVEGEAKVENQWDQKVARYWDKNLFDELSREVRTLNEDVERSEAMFMKVGHTEGDKTQEIAEQFKRAVRTRQIKVEKLEALLTLRDEQSNQPDPANHSNDQANMLKREIEKMRNDAKQEAIKIIEAEVKVENEWDRKVRRHWDKDLFDGLSNEVRILNTEIERLEALYMKIGRVGHREESAIQQIEERYKRNVRTRQIKLEKLEALLSLRDKQDQSNQEGMESPLHDDTVKLSSEADKPHSTDHHMNKDEIALFAKAGATGAKQVKPTPPDHFRSSKTDFDIAIAEFVRAANKEHLQAKHRLAMIYSKGITAKGAGNINTKPPDFIILPDCRAAVKLFKQVSGKGPIMARRLRNAYKQYTKGNVDMALRNYIAAAETGSETAQLNSAWLMEQGHCLRMSRQACVKASLRMWRAAARQGNADACLRVGDYYYYRKLDGDDGKRKSEGQLQKVWRYVLYPEEAMKEGKSWLVSMIRKRLSRKKKMDEEISSSKTCQDGEDAETCMASDAMSDSESTSESKDNEALEDEVDDHLATSARYYRQTADRHNNPRAHFNLGFMYEWGLGVKKDFPLAKRHYDLAASSHPQARIAVKIALWGMSMHKRLVKLRLMMDDWLNEGDGTSEEEDEGESTEEGRSEKWRMRLGKMKIFELSRTQVNVIWSHVFSWESTLIVVLSMVLIGLVRHRRKRITQ